MMITLIYFVFCQLEISDTQFNLYNTNKSLMHVFGYDCLYYDESIGIATVKSLASFCIRPERMKESKDEEELYCENPITFKQLKTNNVKISDLFHWNAVIEIIDLYEKYLLFPNLVNHDTVYCNCSSVLQFGKFCQYDINAEDDEAYYGFSGILINSESDLLEEEMKTNYSTCYIGIQCQTNLFCLDWRQICNGIVDCDYGEDEPNELCLQMETNQCQLEEEFRCNNGFCIPISFITYAVKACLDQSDKTAIIHDASSIYVSKLCLKYPSLDCDEINHGWKLFSCNNGQSIPYSDLTSKVLNTDKTCANNHHLMYLRKLFHTDNETECWKSMICLTGFDYLYSNLNCLNRTIEESCLDEYYFPSNSVVYSFVFFLYDKTNRINWPNPNYICYKKEFCQNNIFIFSTVLKNNLTCFNVNQTNFTWKNFYESILHLFNPCFSSSIQVNNKMFYKCDLSNSFISIYRLKDKNKDCYFNEDEGVNVDLCSYNTNDQFKCLTNQSECIRQSLISDNEYDCVDGSDEYFYDDNTFCTNLFCGFRPFRKRGLHEVYRFQELCDNFVNRHLFSKESNETDETDCHYWPYACNSHYTKCNHIWNCENGSDETDCGDQYGEQIHRALDCKSNQHYCIKLINNNTEVAATCINTSLAGDGIIDCIGGTDERFRSICLEKYPTDFKNRFHCLNSSLCIRPDQICDTIINCPFQDDELVCPWLFKANSSRFHCQNSPSHHAVRCDNGYESVNDPYCQLREHLWFCDLQPQRELQLGKPSQIEFERYSPINENINSVSSENLVFNPDNQELSLIDINNNVSSCNFGYLIKSSRFNNKSYCLCPPTYYGDFCQYQSERLTVLLNIQTRYSTNPLTLFRLIIYLLYENNVILSYDEIDFTYELDSSKEAYLIYLMSERVTNVSLQQRSKSKFVRIDSYIIKETNVQYISSWLFNVPFPFLPVIRLVAALRLVNESFFVMYCTKQCGSHGKCMHYINFREKEYCWCNQGYSGEDCQLKSSFNLCSSTSCSPHSQCVILNEEKKQIKCLCPLGKSGDQCYITHNACYSNPCRNNETCLPVDQRSTINYRCICTDDYSGGQCLSLQTYTYISIDDNITDLSSIPAITVFYGNSNGHIFEQISRYLFTNERLPTKLRIRSIFTKFGFVRIFYNSSKSDYYSTLLCREKLGCPSMNTSVITQNLCKNVSEIFNKTILEEYSYLKRLKLYHLPCNDDHNLRCFFDDYRMCICTEDHNSDCHLFSHEFGTCNNCQNKGLCLIQTPNFDEWKFICLCPNCSFGIFCEFISGNYFLTFDMLIGLDMKRGNTSFSKQSTAIHLTLMFLLLILSISLIFNTISIFVFSNKKLRQVGCDLYLLSLTILSETGLILLFLRFIYMMIIQMYLIDNFLLVKISCISLEYLIRLIPSLFDWLIVCISVERAYTVIQDVQFTKLIALKTLKWSRWIILIVFLFNILTTLHRLFYLKLVDELDLNDEPKGHPWCVLDLSSTQWIIYEKAINIFHLIVPFSFNLLSIIGFIFHKVNFQLKSATRKNKDSTFVIIKQQLLKYKPVIVSPLIILILEIPRFVFTFTFACIDHTWQRYVHLASYLISFLPLTSVLFIYILPSPKFKKELQTFVKKRFRLSLFKTT